MNIQLGIYELFSTIIPGCVYLVSVIQILIMTNILKIENLDTTIIADMSFALLILFLIVAYLLGTIFSPFGLLWYKAFKGKKDQSVESLNSLKLRHKDRWLIDFNDDDWHVLLAFVRTKNLELGLENERHQASSIMLRNISFGFLILAIVNFAQSGLDGNINFLIVGVSLLVVSLITIRESRKFRRWYYDSVLSSVLAYRVDLEKTIKPIEIPVKPRKSRSG